MDKAFEFSCSCYNVSYNPHSLKLSVITAKKSWTWQENSIYLTLFSSNEENKLYFKDADCEADYFNTGIMYGVKAIYSNFKDNKGKSYGFIAKTIVAINPTYNELHFEIDIKNDDKGQIGKVFWPAAMDFSAEKGHGYSIIPQMQGVLIPAKWDKSIIRYNDGKIYDRDGYMAFFGQVDDRAGYCAIFDTPWDANYYIEHIPSESSYIRPFWRTSLGYLRYKRIMLYSFYDSCDYNTFCKKYRSYIKMQGRLVTLEEKIVRNPNVEKMIGTPVVHEGIAVHIHEKSHYYNKDDPKKNDYATPFITRAAQLCNLKERGVQKAYLHLDGWGNHGYDNLHPDVFPPNEAAGGAEGMKNLSDTCSELGYMFGIHDQYRDYYYDAQSFSEDEAIKNIDGSHPYCSIWYGGPQTVLCAQRAPYYVKRNFENFKSLGIKIDGAYLDVFSVVELDECFNEEHRMTRKECAEKRNECFEYLNANGIISSSEEVTDFALKSLALCHHAPFAVTNFEKGEAIGIPIPLFNLVFHDCIIIPWFGLNNKGGWGIPQTDWGFLYALLNGGTIYYGIHEKEDRIEFGKIALELHKKTAKSEMLQHEFIDGNYRRQRTTFANGISVEIDLDKDAYKITEN